MRQRQFHVPLHREVHRRTVSLLVLDETDTDNVSAVVFEEEADALETTSIACPPTRARNTPRELF